MKKTRIAIIGMLTIFVLAIAGTASAALNTGTTMTCYAGVALTVNGQYTYGEEWGSSTFKALGSGGGTTRTQWCMSPAVYAMFLIETPDTTNNAGDYFEICFDSTTAGADTAPNGGTAPQIDDFKLVVTGHTTPTVQWYKGTGTAWATIATPTAFADAAVFSQAQSLSTSPKISAAHYIWEMQIDKTSTALGISPMGYNWNQYIAYYDAAVGGAGLVSWPPAATDTNPDSWGGITYDMAANPTPDVPESFGFIAVALLSCFAVVIGTVLVRKRSKILNLSTSVVV
jgi:hypothetical protein